jgi:hypothetical protein
MSRLAAGHRVRRAAAWTSMARRGQSRGRGGVGLYGAFDSIDPKVVHVGVVCDTTIFIDHAPAGPARASTAEGRAQQAGPADGHARQTTESTTSTPPQAALNPIEVNSATHAV